MERKNARYFDSCFLLVAVGMMCGLWINTGVGQLVVPFAGQDTGILGKIRNVLETVINGSLRFATCSLAVNNQGPKLVQFLLFTRENPDKFQRLEIGNAASLSRSNFKTSRMTRLIVHGWLDGYCATTWMMVMKDELLKCNDSNVVIVDWGTASKNLYNLAIMSSYAVGDEIAKWIKFLQNETGYDPANVHCIGHSLGAHSCSTAGKLIEKLGRISGIDPSMSEHQKFPASMRLVPNDSMCVDVIFTSYGRSSTITNENQIPPTGKQEFFPNGGKEQPRCNSPLTSPTAPEQDLILPQICSHYRAVYLYISSICTCRFVGTACSNYSTYRKGECGTCEDDSSSDCALMGFPAEACYDSTERFYLDTSPRYPYCDGAKRIDS